MNSHVCICTRQICINRASLYMNVLLTFHWAISHAPLHDGLFSLHFYWFSHSSRPSEKKVISAFVERCSDLFPARFHWFKMKRNYFNALRKFILRARVACVTVHLIEMGATFRLLLPLVILIKSRFYAAFRWTLCASFREREFCQKYWGISTERKVSGN